MSEPKFTKGPWALLSPWKTIITIEPDKHKARGMAVDPVADMREYATIIADTEHSSHRVSKETQQANAHLIAAAPEMYDALEEDADTICVLCKRLNPQHENCTSCVDMDRRRFLLAKARGET